MMFEVPDVVKYEHTYINLKIQNPSKENDSYITYEIVIETNDSSFSYTRSSTRRRYSDFRTLCKWLSKQFPYNKLPALPSKEPFKNSYDSQFIQRRQDALQKFLNKLISDRVFLSSKALHLFLQSSFSMGEIKDIIDGKSAIEVQPVLKDSVPLNEEQNNDQTFMENSHGSSSSTDSCAILKPSSETNMNSSIDSRKVSFYDQVTVAEVHIT